MHAEACRLGKSWIPSLLYLEARTAILGTDFCCPQYAEEGRRSLPSASWSPGCAFSGHPSNTLLNQWGTCGKGDLDWSGLLEGATSYQLELRAEWNPIKLKHGQTGSQALQWSLKRKLAKALHSTASV